MTGYRLIGEKKKKQKLSYCHTDFWQLAALEWLKLCVMWIERQLPFFGVGLYFSEDLSPDILLKVTIIININALCFRDNNYLHKIRMTLEICQI